jgi:hypothetical protein
MYILIYQVKFNDDYWLNCRPDKWMLNHGLGAEGKGWKIKN